MVTISSERISVVSAFKFADNRGPRREFIPAIVPELEIPPIYQFARGGNGIQFRIQLDSPHDSSFVMDTEEAAPNEKSFHDQITADDINFNEIEDLPISPSQKNWIKLMPIFSSAKKS